MKTLRLGLAVLVLCTLGERANAQTYTWSGGTSGGNASWNSSTNWAEGLPSSGSNLVFDNRNGMGTIASPLSVSNTKSYGTITFDDINSKLPSVLDINTNASGTTTARTLTVNSSITLTNFSGTVRFNATTNGTLSIALGGSPVTFDTQGTSNLILAPAISGSNGIAKAGTGTLTLSGANTYTGTTVIRAGTLSASNIVVSGGSSNLGNATSAVTLGTGSTQGTLSYTGNSATYTRGFTIQAGGGQLDVTTAGQTLTLDNTNVTGTIGGSFTVGGAGNTTVNSAVNLGTGGFTKTGSGTAVLAGTNTYSGTTTVSGGTLLINANSSGVSGAVTVGNGATLGGVGTLGGAITVSSGGTLQADNGANPGVFTVSGVTIASGGKLAAVIGSDGTNSELAVGASTLELSTGSILKFTSISGFSHTQAATYTLASFAEGSLKLDGETKSNGYTFGSYTHGTGATGPVTIDASAVSGLTAGNSFSLTMDGGNLVLSFSPVPVPEPATVLGIAAAALGAGGFVRRKFRKGSEPTNAA